jgi:hypothetical protein
LTFTAVAVPSAVVVIVIAVLSVAVGMQGQNWPLATVPPAALALP